MAGSERHTSAQAEQFTTVAGLLTDADRRWEELASQGREALHQRGDAEFHKSCVAQQAQILIDMPTQFEALRQSGINVSEDLLAHIGWYSREALDGLEALQTGQGSTFGIQTLVQLPGSRPGDPTELSRLAERYSA